MPALEASAIVGIVGVGLAVGQTRPAYTDFKTNRVLAEGQDARTTGLKKIHQHMHLIKEKDIIRLLNVHDRLDTRHYNLLQDYGYYSLIGWWKAGSLRDESIAWKVDALRTSDISLKHNMGGEGKASGSLQSSEFQLRDNASEAGPSIPMNILSSASPADVASTVVNAGA
ncbi:hypothetical protein GLOTRDRAFT_127496 [Gloeophyllum trabeum ATCC 11539]|uniref:Uncharacterized protein n=1 Tax=Gloeophyllum trabeum (strain ATCC 11539 / FP-39264 / Madison 617) TaxID=670483 RepID=S7QCP7_GLOTA|nr:uncharacterized protein GLOTRDRAFT_127496 [Gloeophyllum trabeum ATCC 11539]EPQ57122.1 hypothetical protein GLOTRDRAFT_127496 [Gloeophyllum trabeum ATCC 11539]